MSELRMLPRRQRGQDLCHMAFRQTLDLLRVADQALDGLCLSCQDAPDIETFVGRALNEMALGESDQETRAASHVLLAHGPSPVYTGILYAAGLQGYAARSEPIRFRPEDFPALSDGRGAVMIWNRAPPAQTLEEQQARFPDSVQSAIGKPIFNFIAHRIAGDRPGTIAAFNYPERATRYEAQVLSAFAVTVGSLWTLAARVAQVEEGFLYLVGALARASEVNDQVTGDHILRVTRYVETLGRALGHSAQEASIIGYSSQLHDVGKIHTPKEILRKPGSLDFQENEIMRQHTTQGEKIIGSSPRLASARKIAGAHHENWDGSGYPRGLAGAAIPGEARIVKLADVYDALRSDRPYKRALSHEEARGIIVRGDDRVDPDHFDPEVLQAFREIHPEFQRIHAGVRT